MSAIRPTIGDSNWFVHDRFGLFIHWGLYALPARHEWIRSKEKISDAAYDVYFKHFDPDLYDPKAWAAAAANAGMKYFVITTKHHDGFCLWDSKLTDYKAPNTPAGRDLLRPMVDAFRERDLRVGLYHSIIDWHHPDFVIDGFHPLRDDPNLAELNRTRTQKQYIEYLHGQTRELLSHYGQVDIMWFDFSYPGHSRNADWIAKGWAGKGREAWGGEALMKMVRQLQPQILVDNRLDLEDDWDFLTPEQIQPRGWATFKGTPVVWEACQTFSGSWGYHRDEASWKSVEQLLLMLIDTVAKGGNLLLNVGPTGRGEFDQRALDRLAGMGAWMKRHGRSIYGCTQAPDDLAASCPKDCRFTWNPQTKRLYCHVLAWPFRHLHLPDLADRVEYAQLLHDASEVRMVRKVDEESWGGMTVDRKPTLLTLELPILKPAAAAVPVIELFLK